VYLLCRRRLQLNPTACGIVILATLLCRSVSVFSAVPASEVPYFGLVMLALLALTLADRQPGWPRLGWLGLGVLLSAAAVSVRYAGLALVPALLFVAVGPANRARVVRTARADRRVGAAMVLGLVIALVAAAEVVMRASPYGRQIAYVWRTTGGLGAMADRVATQAWKKVASLGELGSQTNCCRHLSHSFTAGFVVLGLAVVALVVLGWLARRRLGVIELFILGTAAVVAVYSGGDARFWIGAFPFLFAYGLLGAGRLAARWRWTRYGLATYAAAFVVAGGVWLVNSVELSTATRRFPALWSWQVKSELLATYRVAFGEARPRAMARVEPAALAALRRYEPLAQGRGS
jgi:hypothetical protein